MGREGRPSLGPGTDFGRSLAGHWDQGRPSLGPGMDLGRSLAGHWDQGRPSLGRIRDGPWLATGTRDVRPRDLGWTGQDGTDGMGRDGRDGMGRDWL